MNNLITIENQTAVVSLDTIIKFSENTEDAVQSLIRNNEVRIHSLSKSPISNPTLPRGKSGKQIEWSNVKLNEQQVYFVLTLLKNTENVVKFKLELIKQFFNIKEDLHNSQLRILELQAKSKDKLIEDLSNRSREYRVIVRDGKKYHSATSLMKDEKDTAKSFKKVMREVLDVVTVKMKLTPYYAVTETGLDSGIVVADEHGTPYYADDCIDLYNEAKDM
jgi:phage regulator Rha-like protein